MHELVIACRYLFQSTDLLLQSSRVGISWVEQGETHYEIFDTKESPYTVIVQDSRDEGVTFTAAHIFVERYLRRKKRLFDAEIWRWHYDVWPSFTEDLVQYATLVDYRVDAKLTSRHSFEHITGPELTNFSFLSTLIAQDILPIAKIDRDLVPERLSYRQDYPLLSHPGCCDPDDNTAMFEELLQRDPQSKPLWVM